jgi:hypothetical protein
VLREIPVLTVSPAPPPPQSCTKKDVTPGGTTKMRLLPDVVNGRVTVIGSTHTHTSPLSLYTAEGERAAHDAARDSDLCIVATAPLSEATFPLKAVCMLMVDAVSCDVATAAEASDAVRDATDVATPALRPCVVVVAAAAEAATAAMAAESDGRVATRVESPTMSVLTDSADDADTSEVAAASAARERTAVLREDETPTAADCCTESEVVLATALATAALSVVMRSWAAVAEDMEAVAARPTEARSLPRAVVARDTNSDETDDDSMIVCKRAVDESVRKLLSASAATFATLACVVATAPETWAMVPSSVAVVPAATARLAAESSAREAMRLESVAVESPRAATPRLAEAIAEDCRLVRKNADL